jgi:hypothetical protein
MKDNAMTRFITVHVGCDWPGCETVAPEGEGIVVEKAVAIDGKQARSFLLCKKHLEEFESVVLPLMQAGVKVEQPSSGRSKAKSAGTSSTSGSSSPAAPPQADADGTHPSLVCKIDRCERHGRPLSNRTGMAQHVIRSHGYTDLAAYEAEFGPVATVPRKSRKSEPSVEGTVAPVDETSTTS